MRRVALLLFMIGFAGSSLADVSTQASSERVTNAVQGKWPVIQRCYAKEIERGNIEKGGSITVGFNVNEKGRVTLAWIEESTMNNATLERCTASQFQKLKFNMEGKKPFKGYYELPFRMHEENQAVVIPQAIIKASIDTAIQEKWPKFKKCYVREQIREQNNNKTMSTGKVILHFVVARNGKIETVRIKDTTLNNQNVESCILEQFATININQRLSEPLAGNYPITFEVNP